MPHFPRSSVSRNANGHLRLLTAIDLYAPRGLQFSGKLLRPGSIFSIEDLPRPAVVLECAGAARIRPGRSRYSFETLWILWWFDFAAGEWRERIRTLARDSSWTVDFAPVATRMLYPSPVPTPEDRVRPVVERLQSLIDEDLARVSSEERCAALAALETHIANEIVYAAARMPMASEWAQRLSASA